MAAVPTFRRFAVSDYPTAPNWLGGLFNPLNVFCEQTVSGLNKNLSIGQNVQGQKFSTSFTTLADYATGGWTPINFAYNGTGTPDCLMIGNISKASVAAGMILKPVAITDWNLSTNYIPYQATINYIAGLDPSTKYNITFIIL